MTPGTYLQRRRQAAGKSLADVAAAIATEPRLAEHARTVELQMIESDVRPARFDTIVVLRKVYPFDLDVLAQLVRIALGADDEPPRFCRICACSEFDPCDQAPFGTCWWVEHDLCSRCGDPRPAATSPAPPAGLAA